MNRQILKSIIAFLFTILFMYGCGEGMDGLPDILLTEDDNGQTITVNLETEIIIELSSNPSTGYYWEHANTDGSFIYQDGDSTFIEDETCSGLDGCGGTERMTFKASKTGNGAILLSYLRSSEEDPIDQFSIDVIVE